MKAITIITAKIQDTIYQSILSGEKTYEVRTHDFENAQVIRYVSARDGKELGLWTLEDCFTINSSNRKALEKYTSVSTSIVDELFPYSSVRYPIYVAKLGHETTLNNIFKE